MLKTEFQSTQNNISNNWDKEAIIKGGFNQEQWNQVRSQIDNNLISLIFEFLISCKENQSKTKKFKQVPNFLTRHGIHKNNNYLTLALKKTDSNHKYICNFLNFTRINQSDFEGQNSWYTLLKRLK